MFLLFDGLPGFSLFFPEATIYFGKRFTIARLCAIIITIKVVVDGGQQQLPIQ